MRLAHPLEAQARLLFRAALAIFTVSVGIGLVNGFHLITLPAQVLLTHVHAGTLGWITLSVCAVCFWLFGGAQRTAGAYRVASVLGVALAVSVIAYVAAFLSGNGVARAVCGTALLLLIFALLAWTINASRSVPLSVPRLGDAGRAGEPVHRLDRRRAAAGGECRWPRLPA